MIFELFLNYLWLALFSTSVMPALLHCLWSLGAISEVLIISSVDCLGKIGMHPSPSPSLATPRTPTLWMLALCLLLAWAPTSSSISVALLLLPHLTTTSTFRSSVRQSSLVWGGVLGILVVWCCGLIIGGRRSWGRSRRCRSRPWRCRRLWRGRLERCLGVFVLFSLEPAPF